MDETDDTFDRSPDDTGSDEATAADGESDLTGNSEPGGTEAGSNPVEHPGGDRLPPEPPEATDGEVEAPDPSILDQYEPPAETDDSEPIPAPEEELVPESEQVREAVSAELLESFEAGAGPFEQVPNETFLEQSWFDFSYLDRYDEVGRSWVDRPYAYVSVLYDPEIDEYRYHVTDPILDEFEQYVRRDLQGVLRDVLMYEEVDPERPDREVVTASVVDMLEDYTDRLDPGSLTKVYYYLLRDFVGMGKIDPVMRDPDIEDISCVGVDIPVFVYHRNYRDLRSNLDFGRSL